MPGGMWLDAQILSAMKRIAGTERGKRVEKESA